MNTNVVKTLIAIGVTGTLVLGTGVSALADETDAAGAAASVATATSPATSEVLAGVVSGPLFQAILKNGGSVDANSFKASLDAGVAWETCGASTYGIGDGLMGSSCSDGSIVTEDSMGIAHKTLPLGTCVQIIYNDTVVEATVCDRGPFIAGRDIDLQPAVANALEFDGVGQLEYRVVA